jgi:hypothetical protein
MLLLTSAEVIKALVGPTSALNTSLTLTPGMAFVKLIQIIIKLFALSTSLQCYTFLIHIHHKLRHVLVLEQ